MNISEQLEKWKTENNGVIETSATITIRGDSMNITIQGSSLEDAYAKLAKLYGETGTEKPANENLHGSFQPTFQQGSVFPQTTLDSTKGIQEVLNGKQLLRVHNTAIPLAAGESTITYNGVQYVVK